MPPVPTKAAAPLLLVPQGSAAQLAQLAQLALAPLVLPALLEAASFNLLW